MQKPNRSKSSRTIRALAIEQLGNITGGGGVIIQSPARDGGVIVELDGGVIVQRDGGVIIEGPVR